MIDVDQIRWKMSLWVCFQCKLGSAVTVGFLCEIIYLGLFHSLVVLLESGLNSKHNTKLPLPKLHPVFPRRVLEVFQLFMRTLILPENWKGVFLNVESTSLAFRTISGKLYCVMMIIMMKIDFMHFWLIWFIVLKRNMLISICATI